MKKIIFGVICLFLLVVAMKFIGCNYSFINFLRIEAQGILVLAVIFSLFGLCLFLLREQDKSFLIKEAHRERRRKERIEEAVRKGEDPKQIDWYESYF